MRRTALALSLIPLGLTGCVTTSPHSVCVLEYEIITPEPEYRYLAKAIPEFITNELANTAELRVQDPQDVERYISRRWTVRDTTRLRRLGKALGTEYFILGSVTRLGENFVIESRLFSVNRGHIVPGTAFRETCRSEQDILVQARSIADRLRYQIVARIAPEAAEPMAPGGSVYW
jgi:TolB-like protein